MTIPQYIDFTEKRLQAEAELLANLKAVQAQNEQLQQQIKELENGSSTTETTTEG